MRWPAVALCASLLLAAAPARAAPRDAEALGQQLANPNLDVAHRASVDLLALGKGAAPALASLVAALDRVLPEGVARKRWDPWMALLPEFHENVIRTIDAISPKDESPIAALARRLSDYPRETRSRIVRMFLRLWPESAGVREPLLAIARAGFPELDDDAKARLADWVGSRDEVT